MMAQQTEPQVQDSIEIASEALEEILYRALLGCEHGKGLCHELSLMLAAIDAALGSEIARPERDTNTLSPPRLLLQRLREVLMEAKSPELPHD